MVLLERLRGLRCRNYIPMTLPDWGTARGHSGLGREEGGTFGNGLGLAHGPLDQSFSI